MRRNKLRDFRKSQGLTQPEMAVKLNISTPHYKGIERGVANPSFSVVKRFEELFRSNYNDDTITIFKLE